MGEDGQSAVEMKVGQRWRAPWTGRVYQVLYIHHDGRCCLGLLANVEDTSWDNVDRITELWSLVGAPATPGEASEGSAR